MWIFISAIGFLALVALLLLLFFAVGVFVIGLLDDEDYN
jgi:hypothetical protein